MEGPIKRKDFFIVPNAIFDVEGLSGSEILVYCALARFVNNGTGQCYPSLTTLSKKTHLSRKTIEKAIKVLEKKGLITITSQKGGNNIYTLLTINHNAMANELPVENDYSKLDTGTSINQPPAADSYSKSDTGTSVNQIRGVCKSDTGTSVNQIRGACKSDTGVGKIRYGGSVNGILEQDLYNKTNITILKEQDLKNKTKEQNSHKSENKKKPAKPSLCAQVIQSFNEHVEKYLGHPGKYKATEANCKLIRARAKEGFVLEDFIQVLDTMFAIWSKQPEMRQYLRPSTLFRASKFEGYLNRVVSPSEMGLISKTTERNIMNASKSNFDVVGFIFGGDNEKKQD